MSPAPDDGAPAVLLHDAKIRTMDPARPRASALLARGGRIEAVGEERELLARPGGGDALRVDAGGRLVTPGLIDAHTHLVPAALAGLLVDLRAAKSPEDAAETIEAAHRATAPERWVVGAGHAMLGWTRRPERADLDRVAPGRAVFLRARDGHSAWASSAALALAGVTRETSDPPGGRIGRDATGEPDGLLYENAMALVARLVPAPGATDERGALRAMIARVHAVGVTGVHDLQGYGAWRAYDALRRQRELTLRVWMGFSVGVTADPAGPPLEEALELARDGDDRLRVGAIKCFLDGSLGSRTAHLLEPDEDGGDRGIPTLSADELDALAALARRRGLTLCAHAIGDAAVRTALDAFARWPAEERFRLRPRVEHAQLVSDEDRPRFARLGVVASMQPQHATSDRPLATKLWGARDERGGYGWRQLLDAGAKLAFGSDVPVEPCDPRLGLFAAVTGGDPEASARGRTPRRAITFDEALAAYTTGSAYAARMEGRAGVLAPGALADWVVWDDALDALPAERLPQARVGATWVGGREVWSAS